MSATCPSQPLELRDQNRRVCVVPSFDYVEGTVVAVQLGSRIPDPGAVNGVSKPTAIVRQVIEHGWCSAGAGRAPQLQRCGDNDAIHGSGESDEGLRKRTDAGSEAVGRDGQV